MTEPIFYVVTGAGEDGGITLDIVRGQHELNEWLGEQAAEHPLKFVRGPARGRTLAETLDCDAGVMNSIRPVLILRGEPVIPE